MAIRIQRILLPTDFSACSTAATNYARELATKFDAELHLLHTLEIHVAAAPELGMGLAIPRLIEQSRTAAEKLLASVIDPKWAEGRKVIRVITDGSPVSEIIRYVSQNDIDLIVLSTHGRTGLAHMVLGSVAESVVRMATCPVLTVRPEGHQFVKP